MYTRIYLAGPFFNEVQEQHAISLRDSLRANGYIVYAPVSEKWEEGSRISPQEIFGRNIRWMLQCDYALCQLDYPLLKNQKLGLDTYSVHADTKEISVHKTEIDLPDSGTIWEMGFLFAQGKTIIGYYAETKKKRKLNLMLVNALNGFVDDPLDMFQKNCIVVSALIEWEGEQV